MQFIKPLSEMRSRRNGGKIYGLYRMQQMGLPIPKAFAISPDDSEKIMLQDIKEIAKNFPAGKKVAVRSSAIGEDSKKNSFAGVFTTQLNVNPANSGELLGAIKKVVRSTEKASSYKKSSQIKMGIIIQEMIDPMFAGVAFTDSLTEDGKNAVLIEFVRGLGDKLVSGRANSQKIFMPYSDHNSLRLLDVHYLDNTVNSSIIPYLPELVRYLQIVKQKFDKPMDTEWAIDKKGKVWMLQARPITKQVFVPKTNKNADAGIVASYGKLKVSGKTYFVDGNLKEGPELDSVINKMPQNSVLILTYSDTYYLPAMRKASAIISTNGSVLAHAAIISRELGIPCIVGVKNADKLFPNGTNVQIDTSKGEIKSKNLILRGSRSDIDWGELDIFDNVKDKIIANNRHVLFERLPDGQVAAYLPDRPISDSFREKIEFFSRTYYHASPQVYQTEKYLWFFENKRFKSIPVFNEMLKKGQKMIDSADSKVAKKYFDDVFSVIKNLNERALSASNKFEKFLLEESIEAVHFAGLIQIAQGKIIAEIYRKIKPILIVNNLNFVDFISLNHNDAILQNNKVLKKYFVFMKTVEKERNDMFQRLLDEKLMRPDYFNDRKSRAKRALNFAKSSLQHVDPIDAFYKHLILQSVQDKKTGKKFPVH